MHATGRLFVYGTLMPGQPLWPALARYAASWEPATAGGRLWDTGQGYPAVRFDGSDLPLPGPLGPAGPIPGILVVLDAGRAAEAMEVLDRIEDEGRLYRRVEVVTSGRPAYAYEWLGPTEGLEPLVEGWPRSPRIPP